MTVINRTGFWIELDENSQFVDLVESQPERGQQILAPGAPVTPDVTKQIEALRDNARAIAAKRVADAAAAAAADKAAEGAAAAEVAEQKRAAAEKVKADAAAAATAKTAGASVPPVSS